VYDYVNHSFALVSEALTEDVEEILRRATTSAGDHDDATLHAHVGPIDLAAGVAIEIGPMDETPLPSGRPALRIPIKWTATKAARAFPMMQAELTVYPLTATETQLELVGSYEPPLGPVGAALDAALLHRIAEVSVTQLVRDVARYLGSVLQPRVQTSDATAHP
jgi:hypothetical protein